MELARNGVLVGEFGTPADRARPLLRVTAHVRTATFRWISAAIGGYHDGEPPWPTSSKAGSGPDMLSLAVRGFFSMYRFLRFSGIGAHLPSRQAQREVRPAHGRHDPARRLCAAHAAVSHGLRACAGAARTRARIGSRIPAPGSHLQRHHRASQRPCLVTRLRVLTTLLVYSLTRREIAVLLPRDGKSNRVLSSVADRAVPAARCAASPPNSPATKPTHSCSSRTSPHRSHRAAGRRARPRLIPFTVVLSLTGPTSPRSPAAGTRLRPQHR